MWFRISRKPADGEDIAGHIESGRMLVMLNRDDYWQCAFVIPKDSAEKVKGAGLDAFRRTDCRHGARSTCATDSARSRVGMT